MENKSFSIKPSEFDSNGRIKIITGEMALRLSALRNPNKPKKLGNQFELEALQNQLKELELEVERLKKELAERPTLSGDSSSFKTVSFSSLLNEHAAKADDEDRRSIFKKIIEENKALREV